MAAEMKHRLGIPYRKIRDFFVTFLNVQICAAAFCRADQRLTKLAAPTYALLLDALRRCGVVHADETGWRIGRVNAWLWVFSSPTVTIYAVRTRRGHEVPEEILGPEFDGFLVVDGLAVYDVLEVAKGRCLAHLLRRCREMVGDLEKRREVAYVERLGALLRAALELARRREELPEREYGRQVQEVNDRLDDWLDDFERKFSADVDRLHTHGCKHRGEWLVFLDYPEVPPTNNHAERMLRPAVITRKVGGCNKTLVGALVHGVLSSLLVSCIQQGKRFRDLARRLFCAGRPQALPLEALPDG